MKKNVFLSAGLGLIAIITLAPACSSSDTTTPAKTPDVTITVGSKGNSFDPVEATVKVGQLVRWNFAAGLHNVVSPAECGKTDGILSSGEAGSTTSYDWIADKAQVITYHCDPHCAMGMVGKLTVTQ